MDAFLETPTTFFDSVEALEALVILQTLRLSVVYKSIHVHLGQGQDLIVSIQMYLKYKYTYENAGFCIICTDDFKILKFSTIFHRETSQTPTPPPPTSIWRFSWTKSWRFPNYNREHTTWTTDLLSSNFYCNFSFSILLKLIYSAMLYVYIKF